VVHFYCESGKAMEVVALRGSVPVEEVFEDV